MAKDLVRTRKYIRKFMLMKANIQAVSLKIQTLKSQNTMAVAMKGVTRAMQNMNKQLNLPQIQKILHVILSYSFLSHKVLPILSQVVFFGQEFEKQSEIMDMKEEMMNDAIDDAMEDDDEEEERYI